MRGRTGRSSRAIGLSGVLLAAAATTAGCSGDSAGSTAERSAATPSATPSDVGAPVVSSSPGSSAEPSASVVVPTGLPGRPTAAPESPRPTAPFAGPTPAPATPRPATAGSPSTGGPTAPRCDASALRVLDADTLEDPGRTSKTFVLRTTGAACSLTGYVELRLLAGGSPLPVTVSRGGLGLPAEPPAVVVLRPDTSVSFSAAWSTTPAAGETCPTATAVQVTPPGSGAAITVPTSITPCGGTVAITPIRLLAGVPE